MREKSGEPPQTVLLRTEGPIDVVLTDPVQPGKADAKTGLLIVLNRDDAASNTLPEWAKPFAGDGPVRLLARADRPPTCRGRGNRRRITLKGRCLSSVARKMKAKSGIPPRWRVT